MSTTNVELSVDGPVAHVTLSTEGGINVLSPDLLNRFSDVVAQVRENRNVRATVIEGKGKVYAAGADIKAMSRYDFDAARDYARIGKDVMDAVESMPSVTIAAINGAALGGGLELALACDFRLAVRSAKIGLPEVTLGLIPGWAGISRLPKLVGPSRARLMILSGNPVMAEEGLSFGLVDEVVNSEEDLGPRVEAFARSFFGAGPRAVALAKRALTDGDDVTAFADCFGDQADGREGTLAFLEKRKAAWME